MQRQHREIEDRRDLGEILRAAPDLGRAGQEHQHVAVEPAPARRRRTAAATWRAERAIVGLLDVLDRERERRGPRSARPARRRGTRRPARRRASPTSRPAASSGRRARSRATSASARSPSRWRSWNSSMITQPTPRSSGSREQPPGQHALGDEPDPGRARRPGDRSGPRSRPRRRARRRARSRPALAASRAASRRGCSTTISPSTTPASSSAPGTRVVLPAPGGATSTHTPRSRTAATTSGSTSSIGNASGHAAPYPVSYAARDVFDGPLNRPGLRP